AQLLQHMGQRSFAFSAFLSDPQKCSMEADIARHSQPELFFNTGLGFYIILEDFTKPSFPQRTLGIGIVIEVQFMMYPQPRTERHQLACVDIDHPVLEHQYIPRWPTIKPTRRVIRNRKKSL